MAPDDSSIRPAPAPVPVSGWVCTFYSYKGGVGRSMALANVAALMSRMGRKVLIIDWDLEAPGIEKYLEHDPSLRRALTARRKTTSGVVDLVQGFIQGKRLDWKEHLLSASLFPDKPPIAILTAGRDDSSYPDRLRSIDWDRLFAERGFGDYLEDMREEWIGAYDFVLVDSRTGITDIGGICTIHLPDVVVAMFTANEQSLLGTKTAMERVRAARQELVVSRGRLRVVPLPARDESIAEHQQAKAWRERFEVELSELYREWLPKDVRPKDVIETLKIPYKPYWSFGEPLPAVQEGTRDPAGLGHAYLVLTRLIESRLDWAHAIGRGGMLDAAEQRAAEATTRAAKLQRTSRTVLGLALLALVTVVVWGAVSHERKLDLDGRDRVDQVLRAAAASSDPLEGALLLAELAGASEPPSGAARARALLSRPIPSMVWRGGSAPITRAELSHDGSSFLIVSDAVDLWTDAPAPGLPQIRYGPKDLPDRTHVSLLAPASGSPVFGWFSPDWTLVSTLSGDNQLVAWDVRGDPPKAVSTSRTGDSLVASLDGRLTATATGDTVEVFAPPSETPVVSARFDLDKPPPLVFSLDGRFLFVAAGKQVFRLPLPDPSGPHGKVLSKGDLVQMTWNPVTRVNSMNTSDDGTLVAALASREAAIWQTNGTPSGAMATVGPLFFIKEEDVDAAHLAAKATITLGDYTSNSMVLGWSDGTVALATATPALEPGKRSDIAIRILGKHGASVTDVEFDLPLYRSTNRVPSMVVSGSVDGTIQVWKLGPENGAPVTLRAGGDQVLSVRFDEQVRRVVAATEKAAYIWPLEPATLPERWSDLIGVAREISAACLTVHQRVQLLQETPEAASIHTAACEADHGRAPPTASADAGPFP